MKENWKPVTTSSFKYIYFFCVFMERKKQGLEQVKGNTSWKNDQFWLNYPFKDRFSDYRQISKLHKCPDPNHQGVTFSQKWYNDQDRATDFVFDFNNYELWNHNSASFHLCLSFKVLSFRVNTLLMKISQICQICIIIKKHDSVSMLLWTVCNLTWARGMINYLKCLKKLMKTS